ncbi:hypothetical protein K523DRAFT_267298 [Schizophyllum commune Tattone D]|nr:hypothetical protein K523DRAFT_267298 [Schizophyllum commune Tattone D]
MHTRQSPSYTEYAPLVVQPQPIHQWEAAPETFTPPQYPPNRAQIIRTPSPTPSEQNQLEGKLPYSKGKMLKMYWREALVAVIIIVAFIVIFAMNDKIVHALRPVKSWMDERPWGFVIPLAIYVVISFPPLIGQEIVATFCGMIWGLGEGFGIVAAGTIIGEILLFTGVKYFFSAKLQTKEKSSVSYACYARVIREGGWIMCAVFRLSVFPPHFITVLVAACDVPLWTYLIAIVIGFPRQLLPVYLGVVLDDGEENTQHAGPKAVKGVFIAFIVVVTIAAGRIIGGRVKKIKPEVIYERRKARQQKMMESSESFTGV